MSTDEGIDPEIFAVFLEESAEALAELDTGLVTLEQSPGDRDSLDAVFRAMHSLKGNSAFFGLNRLKGLAHHMEDMLGLMRQGDLGVRSEAIEALLVGVDEIRHMLGRVRAGDEELPLAAVAAYEAALSAVSSACVEPEAGDVGAGAQLLATIDAALARPDASAAELRKALVALRGQVGATASAPEPAADSPAAPEGHAPGAEAAPASTQVIQAPDAAAPPAGGVVAAAPLVVASADTRSMRVDEAKIDQFLDYVGELIVLREMLNNVGKRVRAHGELRELGSEFQRAMEAFADLSHDLQTSIMEVRKVPVRGTLRKVPRIVRDLSSKRGKEVRVVLEGESHSIDKSMMEAIESPLTHMVRNAVDHGIESPEAREAAGKPREGSLRVAVSEEADTVRVDITDDGAGIDAGALRAKAVRDGMLTESAAQALTDREAWDLLFAPGLSTAKEVTDISGRGVGMDVVKRGVTKLGGRIDIDSTMGRGTTFSIIIPKTVTVQIFDGFLVRVGGHRFVLPLATIRESFRPLPSHLVSVAERGEFIERRGQVLPLVRVNDLLRIDGARRTAQEAIVVSVDLAEHGGAGLLVDEVLGVQQLVLRDVNGIEARRAPFSGGAVLGDGRVALVVDVERLGELVTGDASPGGGGAHIDAWEPAVA